MFALHAFNLETAKIRATTSDHNIGRMRLLWWRQAVTQAADGRPPDHPVVQALADAGARHGWTWRYLEQLLDAREADLGLTQPENWEQHSTGRGLELVAQATRREQMRDCLAGHISHGIREGRG